MSIRVSLLYWVGFVSLGSVWGKVFFLSRSNRGGGTSPFVHKSFPNIRGMMLGGQIVSRWRWVGQSWAGEVAPSLEISVEPSFWGPGYVLGQGMGINYEMEQCETKFLTSSYVLFKKS